MNTVGNNQHIKNKLISIFIELVTIINGEGCVWWAVARPLIFGRKLLTLSHHDLFINPTFGPEAFIDPSCFSKNLPTPLDSHTLGGSLIYTAHKICTFTEYSFASSEYKWVLLGMALKKNDSWLSITGNKIYMLLVLFLRTKPIFY